MQLKWNQMLERMMPKGRITGSWPPAPGRNRCRIARLDFAAHRKLFRESQPSECVFRTLTTLAPATQQNVVAGLSRDACRQILNEERACRNLNNGKQLPDSWAEGQRGRSMPHLTPSAVACAGSRDLTG
jgi:hypothetical protein